MKTNYEGFNYWAENARGIQRAAMLAKYATDSRQQARRRRFSENFAQTTEDYSGLARSRRRRIARSRAARAVAVAA